MIAVAAAHKGFTISSTVAMVITMALILFVVWKAWRGSKKQVVSAMAKAIAQVRAEVNTAAQATATNTVQVNVGTGTQQLAQLPPEVAARVAALLAAIGVEAPPGLTTATPEAPRMPPDPLDAMEAGIGALPRPKSVTATVRDRLTGAA